MKNQPRPPLEARRFSLAGALLFFALPLAALASPPVVDSLHPELPYLMEDPSDDEILANSALPEALVPMGSQPRTRAENEALGHALLAFHDRAKVDDVSALADFVRRHPQSRWRPALELNLGIVQLQTGYFTRALDAFQAAWEHSREETAGRARAVADRALGEYALMLGRLGRTEKLEALVAATKDRVVVGPGRQLLDGALQGLGAMRTDPGMSYRCGPFAVENVGWHLAPKKMAQVGEEKRIKSGRDGTSVAQLLKYQAQLGLDLVAVRRPRGAELPLPAVVHWKAGHFAAIVKERGGATR